MGNAHVTGHDPEDPNAIEHQIGATREQYKETVFPAQEQRQIWSLNTHLRTIEKLGPDHQFTFVPDGPGDNQFTDSFRPEKLSSFLVQVWKYDPNNQTWSDSDDFDGLIDLRAYWMNRDTEGDDNYLANVTHGGTAAIKVEPKWYYAAAVTINYLGSESGIYIFQLYGERSYDMDTEIGDITIDNVKIRNAEKEPVNVQPLEELVPEDIKWIHDYTDDPLVFTSLTRAQIDALFDKDCDTTVTLLMGHT